MNWQNLVCDLRAVMTLEEIAKALGLKSKGAVHGISTGYQKKITWEVGDAILRLHKRKIRNFKKAKA